MCVRVLTVDDDLDHPEVNLSPGQDSSLAGVRALIGLLDAPDLKAAGYVGEANWSSSSSRRDRKQEVEVRVQVTNVFAEIFRRVWVKCFARNSSRRRSRSCTSPSDCSQSFRQEVETPQLAVLDSQTGAYLDPDLTRSSHTSC